MKEQDPDPSIKFEGVDRTEIKACKITLIFKYRLISTEYKENFFAS
jgi:hypothetical protein